MNIKFIFKVLDATKKQKELITNWATKAGKDPQKVIEWVESAFKSDAEQVAAAKWIIQGYDPKVFGQALYICQQKKLDPMKQNPSQLIEDNPDLKPKVKPINPDKVLTDKKEEPEGNVSYAARDEDMEICRQIIDTHFGEKSNPWCLLQAKEGKLTEGAYDMWKHYSAYPKRIAFRNGKLLAFSAGTNENYREWWDFRDRSFPFIPYNGKTWESLDGYTFEIKRGSVYRHEGEDLTARLSNEYSENIEESDVDIEVDTAKHQIKYNGLWCPYTQDEKGNYIVDCPLMKCTVDADMYLQGPYKTFYTDGNPKVECTYKDGKHEGPYAYYYPNGQLRRTSIFKNGEEDGVSKAYAEDGTIKESVTYKDGELNGKSIVYWSNGKPKSIVNYKDGEEDGMETSYYEDGSLKMRCGHKDGHVNGKFESFFSDGTLNASGTYVEGKKEGEFICFYPDGLLHWKANFKNSEYDGEFEDYYQGGQLKEKCTYKDGVRNGYAYLYTRDGELYSKDYYENGRRYSVNG